MDIGTYVYKENNERGLVYAIFRSILTEDESNVLARKYNDSENFYFKLERNSGNSRHYQDLMEFLSFSNYKGKMKHDDSVFSEKTFGELYKPVEIVPIEKRVKVGEIYADSDGNRVYVLGVVMTSLKDDEHTIIIRKIINDKFNNYINYNHEQFGATPDLYNCLFIERKTFIERYKMKRLKYAYEEV